MPLYTDKGASSVRLAELVKGVERGDAGMVNPHKESMQAEIERHVEDYLTHLRAQGANPKHLSERERLLRTVLCACNVKTLADLAADRVTAFVASLQKKSTPILHAAKTGSSSKVWKLSVKNESILALCFVGS
ncbi:MAG: hypothetical protein ACYC3I_22710 [Gemmataceae bacterium]